MKPLAYAISWEWDRHCTGCGRFCSEAQTAGMDLRHGFRFCELCLITRERRLEARLAGQSAWAAIGAARSAVASGAA